MDERQHNRKHSRKSSDGSGIIRILALLFAAMTLVLILSTCSTPQQTPDSTGGSGGSSQSGTPDDTGSRQPGVSTDPDNTDPDNTDPDDPTAPYIVSTASVGVTGDVLVHGPVINAANAAASSANSYDFTSMYTYIAPYFESYDYMIANLETTLGGAEAGKYQGWPTFNCPDSMVDALKGAGVDMLLTANNHSYDTGYNGMMRTQQVIAEKGMDHLGTVQSEEETLYTVKEINGIKVGMVCYTYETGRNDDGRKLLNDILLSAKATPLISSFSYNDLQGFYDELKDTLTAMKAEGAEATMVFIHWGNEYELSPSATQQKIAQELCNLGVDIIVGGHPHVIQPFKTLTSEDGHTTYCLYSMGNALSNQRRDTLTTANANYTEDGMIFGVEFQKWSDGTVEISEISVLPTWVNKEWRTDRNIYAIIPLDATKDDWTGYDVTNQKRLVESYNRTLSLVGEGLNICREALGLEAVPTELDN